MSKLDFPGEQSPDRSSERNIDPRSREFMDLVDCSADELKDIPLARPLTIEELSADCNANDPEARQRSLGDTIVYFGKHKGKKLNNVPLAYLSWAITQQSQNKSFRKFQRRVREFFGMPSGTNQIAKQPQFDFESSATTGKQGQAGRRRTPAKQSTATSRRAPDV